MTGKRREIKFIVTITGCHECTSHAPNTHGYPFLWVNGKPHNMHRVLYIEKYGELPSNIVVRHKCDNRKCINLEHLETGSHKDNSNDCKMRGRLNTPRGEKRSDCKLTDAQILEIRNDLDTQGKIAKKYKVNQSTVSRIKSGEKRQHV